MSAEILNGIACAARIKQDIGYKIRKRVSMGLAKPGLDVILVGDDPASKIYVQHKQKACQEVGISSTIHELPVSTTQEELIACLQKCNESASTNGILVQLPLPNHLNSNDLLELIKPIKDVDGFHPYNIGRLLQKRPLLRPCTPFGIMTLLGEIKEDMAGLHAVVVGASNIVGRPMALELLLARCTVTICHIHTKNLAQHVQDADILVSAIGKPGVIQSSWIKPGARVIDVGVNRLESGAITGDIDFETAKQRAGWITPVPGGVGPMTVATLLENTLFAAELQDAARDA
jgi:methylenetetrahydrofolate dehydrogenase (NADP+)/methenyltetrahydrofolate cyclohydrolase